MVVSPYNIVVTSFFRKGQLHGRSGSSGPVHSTSCICVWSQRSHCRLCCGAAVGWEFFSVHCMTWHLVTIAEHKNNPTKGQIVRRNSKCQIRRRCDAHVQRLRLPGRRRRPAFRYSSIILTPADMAYASLQIILQILTIIEIIHPCLNDEYFQLQSATRIHVGRLRGLSGKYRGAQAVSGLDSCSCHATATRPLAR